jgi:signal transduction histidine kinase
MDKLLAEHNRRASFCYGGDMSQQFIVEHWLLKHARMSGESLTNTQITQAYARLGFASAGLLYLMLHAPDFAAYKIPFLVAGSLYYLVNLISIPMIRRTPLSAFRCLFFPIFDIAIVSFCMLIDGGHSSGLFFLLLLVIIGNGLRFGNTFLLYTQAMCIIGLSAIIFYMHFYLQAAIDYSLLSWQIVSLLAIPFYVFLIGKRAEEAVQGRIEAEESAYNLLNKGPLPVFTFELDNEEQPRILYANRAIYEIFQIRAADLVGECTDMLVLPEDSPEMISFCRETFRSNQENQENRKDETNTAQNMYIRSRDISGKTLKLQCTAICIRWHKRWMGICFMLDISARESMQEELESVHRQGYMSTLVAGIVHDFRNVLTNMIGYAEVLQMGIKDETANKQLGAIIAAGDRGSELITHLLKLSKNGETDSLPAYAEGELILRPLENIMGLARLQMPPHIKLVCQIDEPLHDVAISIVEIEQILMNLINNSMQAIHKKGHIHVRINNDPKHRLSKPGHPCMCIRVADNGSGIKSEDLDNVFKAFWTSKDDRGGTGLGLTMVQRIVKRNHGSIEIESVADKETRFTIHLPAYIADGNASVKKANKPASETTRLKPKALAAISGGHVLLVDDVPDILKIHQAMLARLQYTSALAEHGKQALDIFQQQEQHFDLIITDFRMPVMDGLELVENIRKLDANIPILMITAFGEDRQLQRVADYHVTLINKPVSMDKFQRSIAETIAAS